ncbi:nitroreductase family protein [bacterium]|nr:nitroreductase family protein [bacterium]
METTEAIHGWRSIRRYKDVPVSDEALRAVLNAGRRAPSWENVQPWHFIVIEEDETKSKLAELASGQKFITKAPIVIAVCGDLSAWEKPKNKEALMELAEAGVMKVNEEIIDKVMLNDPVFCVAENGPAIILSRTFEQLGIAYGFMGIEAVNQGLGMCVVGALNSEVTGTKHELYQEIKAELAIPDKMYLLTLLTLGVPAEEPKARPRKAFDAIVSKGKIGRKL